MLVNKFVVWKICLCNVCSVFRVVIILIRRRKMFKLVEVLFNYNDSGLENICRISDKSWIEKK